MSKKAVEDDDFPLLTPSLCWVWEYLDARFSIGSRSRDASHKWFSVQTVHTRKQIIRFDRELMISSELTEIGTISIDPRKVCVISRAANEVSRRFLNRWEGSYNTKMRRDSYHKSLSVVILISNLLSSFLIVNSVLNVKVLTTRRRS